MLVERRNNMRFIKEYARYEIRQNELDKKAFPEYADEYEKTNEKIRKAVRAFERDLITVSEVIRLINEADVRE